MDTPGRLLGLDVGEARTGAAVSDPLGIVATPLETIRMQSDDADIDAVARLVGETDAVGIVVGLPLNQDGGEGPQARKVQAFIERLRQRVGIEIVTQDERFTSAIAQRTLRESNVRGKNRKKYIDQIAAQQILQTYLDRRANLRKSRP